MKKHGHANLNLIDPPPCIWQRADFTAFDSGSVVQNRKDLNWSLFQQTWYPTLLWIPYLSAYTTRSFITICFSTRSIHILLFYTTRLTMTIQFYFVIMYKYILFLVVCNSVLVSFLKAASKLWVKEHIFFKTCWVLPDKLYMYVCIYHLPLYPIVTCCKYKNKYVLFLYTIHLLFEAKKFTGR